MIFLYYTTLILIYDALSSFRLYYIQFKEVKILWRLGAEYEGWGPDNPNTPCMVYTKSKSYLVRITQ